VRPVAVRLVYRVAQAVRIPIVGIGGIASTEDALEFLMAGASAVQVGTATFVNPSTALDIVDGLANYLQREGLAGLHEVVGVANPGMLTLPRAIAA
jgi:dihydroorotate dehydrogenase (NAD+) catalytic subunit